VNKFDDAYSEPVEPITQPNNEALMSEALAQDHVLAALAGAAPVDKFLGNLVEIAMVTYDIQKTMDGLLQFGIGPWQVFEFCPKNTSNQTYRGKPSAFVLKVGFAQSGSMILELMEPVSGPNIFSEFLEAHGEGIHHVAYDCNNIPFKERIEELNRRGFEVVQSGSWLGTNHFAFL
jgi:hypothetical protein